MMEFISFWLQQIKLVIKRSPSRWQRGITGCYCMCLCNMFISDWWGKERMVLQNSVYYLLFQFLELVMKTIVCQVDHCNLMYLQQSYQGLKIKYGFRRKFHSHNQCLFSSRKSCFLLANQNVGHYKLNFPSPKFHLLLVTVNGNHSNVEGRKVTSFTPSIFVEKYCKFWANKSANEQMIVLASVSPFTNLRICPAQKTVMFQVQIGYDYPVLTVFYDLVSSSSWTARYS